MNYYQPTQTGDIYHVFTKSIAKFKIFLEKEDFVRFKDLMRYYQYLDLEYSYSDLFKAKDASRVPFPLILRNLETHHERYVDILCFCLMSTHLHFVLRQNTDHGIHIFMSKILNSYSRYFNLKHFRKGPLWCGRFKRRLIENDDDLWHMTRYIHLNPTTGYLSEKPGLWTYSSYSEYLGLIPEQECLCKFQDYIDIHPAEYQKFVEERIEEQRELDYIKKWEQY